MKQRFSKRLEAIPPSGIRAFFDLVIGAKDILSLGVGEPDFVTPQPIMDGALDALNEGRTSYTSNKGLVECREKIAHYLKTRFKCHYNFEDEILLTSGVSEAVDITLRALLNPGDEVIIHEPSYVCYAPLIHLAGGKVITLDTSKTNFIPDPKQLEKSITKNTKAIILCSPNNPTGMVIPKAVQEEICKLIIKHDLWLISDEIYAELIYDSPYHSFASFNNMKERTILLNGFSKAFAMTGWRLGYLCGPEALVSRALKIHQYSALCAPIMSQYAAIEALNSGLPAVENMRKSYHLRRNFVVNRLNELGLETLMPEGAFYCFTSIKSTGLTAEDFAYKLLDFAKIAVVPGTAFGASGEGYIRICYAIDLQDLKKAMNGIANFLRSLDGCD